MSFADLIPDELKEGFAERNIQIGSVIKVYVTDTNPPKEKRLILVGASWDKLHFATVYINTAINPNIFTTHELIDLNYEIASEGCDFLDYDCFVDCSKLKSRPVNWLQDILNNEPTRLLGTVPEDDMKEIRKRIKSAPTISKNEKKNFGLSL
ncbi:hypothetical protein ACUN24_20505 [Pedobacter sp. WC2501]|uniref:hypothetical protein n=1 Tax=Pedobacter sp. WC2501 TaxID=3461400 RepID=UPI0040459647